MPEYSSPFRYLHSIVLVRSRNICRVYSGHNHYIGLDALMLKGSTSNV